MINFAKIEIVANGHPGALDHSVLILYHFQEGGCEDH